MLSVLASPSCDVDNIISHPHVFFRSRLSKLDATWIFSCVSCGIGMGITWWWQHHKWHSCIPYVKKIEMRSNITFVVMWHHWYWYHQQHHCIPLVKIIKMRCNMTFGHVTPLVLASASCHADGIINGTTAFFRSGWSKWGATWSYWWCNAIGWNKCQVMLTSMAPLYSLGQNNWNEM